MTKTYSIRPATLDDAAAIAAVQVETWHTSYKGILPDALIERMEHGDRTKAWTRILTAYAESGRGAAFVAEVGGDVRAFGSWNPQRDDDLLAQGFDGEVTSLYVTPDHQREGLGQCLLTALARDLVSKGYNAVALWVILDNVRAVRFYEALGGTRIMERAAPQDGGFDEVAFGWTDLSVLSGRT